MKAIDIIPTGISSVAVFTRGYQFDKNEDGTGKTGNWNIDPERDTKKVIIYCRPEGESQADVYIADVIQIESSNEKGDL